MKKISNEYATPFDKDEKWIYINDVVYIGE
jgi:hypothetical protein